MNSADSLVLSYEDAARAVHEHATILRPSSTESVSLLDSLDRALADPVVADRDQPPFARSTRDGFACRSADLALLLPLEIAGRLRAGEIWTGPPLQPGHAIEIMTGAPVPAGADCILMVEHATVEASRITPARRLQPGENIVPAGAEARVDQVLIEPGTQIGPQHIALAAACGYETVSVYAPPRVAILATGDELVPLGQQPLPHQIRNSNSYSLAAQVARHGGHAVIHPAVRDNLQASEAAIRAALDCDLLILSGGVSMGKYDFVEQALANLNAEFFFTGARIQPGKPVVFGRLPEQNLYFFGLPGNPVSTLVTFTLFAAPLLAALAGRKDLGPHFAQAKLTQAVVANPKLTRFLPAYLQSNLTEPTIQPIPWQGSGDQSAAAKTNCFLVVPENTPLKSQDMAAFLRL
ncbi:MAG TPA: gephyrin-like molybdotransferase Glp [Bryobacteraceae bacterium]|nr:gephyrin-like molybdotransferase Glp [Bryobacteraceae bacterium]